MDERGSADILRFDGFRFDRRRGGCLFRLDEAGVAEPVPVRGRGLALLGLLIERHGELVPKDEIMKVVWLGRVVEEANLNVQIAKLRRILDANREQGSCIQTIAGHGYRFVAPVTPDTGELIPAPSDDGPLSPPRTLIIVLHFAGLSGDRTQQYFAAGITEDLTIDLSPFEDMLASARLTAVDSRKPVQIKQIRRAAGAEPATEQLTDALRAAQAGRQTSEGLDRVNRVPHTSI
jgi:DNA-binding winged helix-turn-helix (wHTH) protein